MQSPIPTHSLDEGQSHYMMSCYITLMNGICAVYIPSAPPSNLLGIKSVAYLDGWNVRAHASIFSLFLNEGQIL